MSKLATPVQYEDALDELNTVRPLSLADKCKLALVTPLLCVNPASESRPATGKLARCNDQGALLKGNKDFADNYLSNSDYLTDYDFTREFTYPQKVKGILCGFFYVTPACVMYWCDPTYTIFYQTIPANVWVWLPFVGDTIHFIAVGDSFEIVFEARGFYK